MSQPLELTESISKAGLKQGYKELEYKMMVLLYQNFEPKRALFVIFNFQILLLYLMSLSFSIHDLKAIFRLFFFKDEMNCFLAVTQVSCPSVAVRTAIGQIASL